MLLVQLQKLMRRRQVADHSVHIARLKAARHCTRPCRPVVALPFRLVRACVLYTLVHIVIILPPFLALADARLTTRAPVGARARARFRKVEPRPGGFSATPVAGRARSPPVAPPRRPRRRASAAG